MFDNVKKEKPVTVLGKTFANDDERRKYFTEDLRKKLPELKKIEGFPIGEDEDILNLSDPPYYTACPNPWINDFIQEWEDAKTDKTPFYVKEPYAADVTEGKNNPIYNAHSYHTKVPHPAIMRYILHYTKPGDIILDGFAGTGMTGVATQMCANPDLEFKTKIENEWKDAGKGKPQWGARKAILGDLSPIASFIAYNYNTPVDADEFEEESTRILKEVEKEYGWMYETYHADGQKGKINYVVWSDVFVCPDCGNEIIFWDAAVDEESNTVKEEFNCPNCNAKQTKKSLDKAWVTIYDKTLNENIKQTKSIPVLINYSIGTKRFEKKPDKKDIDLIKKIEDMDIPYWYPKEKMMNIGEKWGDTWRAGVHFGISHVHHFYTKRNLWVIAFLWKLFKESEFKSLFECTIMSCFARASIRNRYMPEYGNRHVGVLAGTLYIPTFSENDNVLNLLKNRLPKVTIYDKAIKRDNCSISVNTATKLYNVKDNSISYIFTDPPFGANIMYSELNFISESWIEVKTNNKTEAIENKTQNKGFIEYTHLMTECFKEYYRVLKPSKWMTVEFSNTRAAVWNSIQTAIQKAGFIVANVSTLDKKRGGMRALVCAVSVKQDLIISCYKPSEEFIHNFEQTKTSPVSVWEFVGEHLKHLPIHIVENKSNAAVIERSPKILYDRLITFYIMKGIPVPIDAKDFQDGLRKRYEERDGMYFLKEQVAEYDKKKGETKGNVQWALFISNENEGIEWLKLRLKEKPQKYQDIQPEWMQSIFVRKGDILPELLKILDDNFLKDNENRYYIPDEFNQKQKDEMRIKGLLKEFDQYKDTILRTRKALKEVRVESLRAGFKNCWDKKDWNTIIMIGEKIPQDLLMEDEFLLMYYDIAKDKV